MNPAVEPIETNQPILNSEFTNFLSILIENLIEKLNKRNSWKNWWSHNSILVVDMWWILLYIFRTWHNRLKDQSEELLQGIIVKESETNSIIQEVQVYLKDSFGNSTRIDYGTGKETIKELRISCSKFIFLPEMGLLGRPSSRRKFWRTFWGLFFHRQNKYKISVSVLCTEARWDLSLFRGKTFNFGYHL